jgi:uncharacterized protein YjbJ (UPF0337 family)
MSAVGVERKSRGGVAKSVFDPSQKSRATLATIRAAQNERTGVSGVTPKSKEENMDENRIAGTAKNLGGQVQEEFGRVTGDTATQAKGAANRVRGAAQDLYGQARDAGSELAGAAANRASSLETRLRDFIETQPYTAVAIAAGLGWLLGRTNRPF